MNILRNVKIRNKFFLSVAGLIFLIIIIILTIVYNLEKEAFLSETKESSLGIARILSHASIGGFLSSDYTELQNIIDSFQRQESYIDVKIVNRDTVILAATNSLHIDTIFNSEIVKRTFTEKREIIEEKILEDNNHYLDVSYPIMAPEGLMGTTFIRVLVEDSYNKIKRTRNVIIFIGFLFLIASFFISYFISNAMTKPIHDLFRLTKEFGKGRFKERIKIYSKDEIGELSKQFNQMADDIIELEDEIRQSERFTALGKAASIISHEIKSPLTALEGYTNKIIQSFDDKNLHQEFQYIINTEFKRLKELLSNLLTFSKKENLSFKILNLRELTDYTINLVEKREHVSITINIEENISIKGDFFKLVEVILNLVKNAHEAIEEKGSIDISSSIQNGQILLKIADNGKGIKQEFLDNIFEPFVTSKKKGTGLGLAICYKIMKEHNGTIEVKSKEGEGTTFILTFPGEEKSLDNKSTDS